MLYFLDPKEVQFQRSNRQKRGEKCVSYKVEKCFHIPTVAVIDCKPACCVCSQPSQPRSEGRAKLPCSFARSNLIALLSFSINKGELTSSQLPVVLEISLYLFFPHIYLIYNPSQLTAVCPCQVLSGLSFFGGVAALAVVCLCAFPAAKPQPALLLSCPAQIRACSQNLYYYYYSLSYFSKDLSRVRYLSRGTDFQFCVHIHFGRIYMYAFFQLITDTTVKCNKISHD